MTIHDQLRLDREAQELDLRPHLFRTSLSPEEQLDWCRQCDEEHLARKEYGVIKNPRKPLFERCEPWVMGVVGVCATGGITAQMWLWKGPFFGLLALAACVWFAASVCGTKGRGWPE